MMPWMTKRMLAMMKCSWMTKSKRPLTLMIVNLDEQEEDELEGEEGGNTRTKEI